MARVAGEASEARVARQDRVPGTSGPEAPGLQEVLLTPGDGAWGGLTSG